MPPSESSDDTPSEIPPEPKVNSTQHQPNNPLHGIKLADILEDLVEQYGWEGLAERININCFKSDPSIKSSLKFLRKTQWAREKVERLYLRSIGRRPRR